MLRTQIPSHKRLNDTKNCQLWKALVEACREFFNEVSSLQKNGDDRKSDRPANARFVPGTRPPDDGQREGDYAGKAETSRADQDAAEFLIHVGKTPAATWPKGYV